MTKKQTKKRSRHWETLSRVERENGSETLIDTMKKNEDLSVVTKCFKSSAKKVLQH